MNNFFEKELAEDGYTGCEVRPTPSRTEIIIRATHTKSVLGDKGQRIRELTAGAPLCPFLLPRSFCSRTRFLFVLFSAQARLDFALGID